MPKPFCYAPWVALTYRGTPDQRVSPCCEWNGEYFNGNAEEYVRSDFLANIKENMMNNDYSVIKKTCAECLSLDAYGGTKSSRHFYRKLVDNGTYNPERINMLDYRPDNLCNLKCIMCAPMASNLIEEEAIKYEEFVPLIHKDTTDVVNIDLYNLKTLKLVGGEPTVNKKMFFIMDYLIEHEISKNISIHYITNCTSINSFWLDRVKQFKNHTVTMSIDAIGPTFEYIRHGAKWNTVKLNVEKLISISDGYNFNLVAQAVNFAVIEEWIDYFLQYDTETLTISELHGNRGGDLDVIPSSIKNEKMKFLEKINHPFAKTAYNFLKKSRYDRKKAETFWKNTLIRDSRRGTNIFDLNPVFERMRSES